jgi:uncharacterized protein with PhoU and TrkA domain
MKKIMGCVELGKWFGDHSSAAADIAEILQKVALKFTMKNCQFKVFSLK